MKTCKTCQNQYEITEKDSEFFQKMSLPEPCECPKCREQKRLAFRNERNLYKVRSFLSGKELVSNISPDSGYKVISADEWWGDDWDGLEYGRDFDFGRTFAEQFDELMHDVPMMAGQLWKCENCDYSTYTDTSRNCYLVSGGSGCEDCYYSNLVDGSRDCIDVTGCSECELLYDCVDCVRSNFCLGCIRCENSHDLVMCFDCRNCSDCILCTGLDRKRFCILNKQYSEEDYYRKKAEIDLKNGYGDLKAIFLERISGKVNPKLVGCEDCSGDNLLNSKRCKECYESNGLEDCAYMKFSMNCKDCYDIVGSSNKGCELSYNSMSIEGQNIVCGFYIAGYEHIYYSYFVAFCRNVFGCVGIKRKENFILNKQYSAEEYGEMKNRIIEHMKKTGEWGEFFPMEISPFPYHETAAQDVFPRGDNLLKKHEAIEGVPSCRECGRNFKIIDEERRLYRKFGVSKPSKCHHCRILERMKLRE